MKLYKRLSELTDHQKGHLAWRLDNRTYCGYITAGHIARGNHGDKRVDEIFREFDMTPHQAKIHANKVQNFTLTKLESLV